METGPEQGQEMFQTKAKDQPTAKIMSGRQDRGPHKDINPLGPKRGYIRARRMTIGGYIRTLKWTHPLPVIE